MSYCTELDNLNQGLPNSGPGVIMYGFESLKDLFEVLLVPAVGGVIALFWPELQSRDKRKRFETLIVRELEEIAPFPEAARLDARFLD